MALIERYVRADASGSGDGTGTAATGATGAWTWAQMKAGYTAGMKIIPMAAGGVISLTTTAETLPVVATSASPVEFEGCNTVKGDCEADLTLAVPQILFTTGTLNLNAVHHTLRHLRVTSASTTRTLNIGAAGCATDRVFVENTNAVAGAMALACAQSALHTRGHFKATATAAKVVSIANATTLDGCEIQGGIVGVEAISQARLQDTVVHGTISHGFHAITTASIHEIDSCTFRNIGGDAIRFDVLPTTYCKVKNSVIADVDGIGINNNTGTASAVVRRLNNSHWSNTGGNESGFGDSTTIRQVTETADPHVSPTNLSLAVGALSRSTALPARFAGGSLSYGDRGAVQVQPVTGEIAFTLDEAVAAIAAAVPTLAGIADAVPSLADIEGVIPEVPSASDNATAAAAAMLATPANKLATNASGWVRLQDASINEATFGDVETGPIEAADTAAIAAASAAAVAGLVIETGVTLVGALSLAASGASGKLSGANTETVTLFAAGPTGTTTPRIVATVDADGNRTATILTLPT